jgi:type I restriction enzyme S subunit
MDGEFHCYEWCGEDALLNQRVCRIQDFKIKLVEPRFIYFAVNQYLDKIEQDTGYTTVKHISSKQILAINIPLPPLPEQKRIVDLISSVDAYIENLQQQLESVKTSRNAILHELLTTGGDDWVETTLGQISKCAGGCAFPDAFQGNKEGIPFIKVSDMNSQDNEKYIEISNNSVSAEVVDDLRLRIWDKGTVIFPKVGAALLTEKRRILTTKTIFDNNIMGLVPNEKVLSEFLFLLMLQIRFSDHVQPGAVPSIKNSIVEAISVLLPSLDEQKRIVTIISELDSFIHCTETSMNRTKALRSGLLSQLLSGEHEIPASYDKVIGAA